MSARTLPALALCCLSLAACGNGSGLLGVAGPASPASVRFVNVSASTLDLAVGGSVPAGNGNIATGTALACFQVPDPSASGLSVRKSGTTAELPGLLPSFSSDGRYALIAYPGASGSVLFASLPTVFIPVTGRAALRVFNGVAAFASADVYVTAPGSAFGLPRETGIAFGRASGSVDVAAGSNQVRLVSAGPVITELGTYVLEAGKGYTLVVVPGAPALLVPDC